MAKTTQKSAIDELLATGKYETYTNASGETDVRLKQENQTYNPARNEGEPSLGPGGGMGGAGEARSIITQSPGWEGTVLDGFDSVKEMQDFYAGRYDTPTPEPAQPAFDVQDYLRQLAEAQRASRIAALDKARASALTDLDAYRTGRIAAMDTARGSNLTNFQNALDASMQAYDTEGAAIAPAYYDKRNQAAGQSDVGAMNFANYMASRGIKGAAGAMPEIYRNAGLNTQIGALNQAEAADMADLAGRRSTTQNAYNTNVQNLENAYNTDINALNADYDIRKLGIQNAYDADVAGANADIDAASLQAYIDQLNADRLYALQEAQMTGYLSGTPTLEGMQYQQKQTDAERQQWLDTIGQFGNDYQAEIDRVRADGDATNDWQISYLNAARQQKLQQQAEAQAAAAVAASEAEQQAYKNALQRWQTYGTATVQDAAILGVPVGARTADYNISNINAATSRMNAETSRQNANKPKEVEYDYKTDPKFQSEVADIASGSFTLEDVKANAAALQAAYGYDGYMELVRMATP